MSTHLYLRCISHDPPIDSDQVGHNLSQLTHIQQRVKDRGEFLNGLKASGLDIWDLDPVPSADRAINNFLHAHPNCDYELWDEHKRQHMLVPEGPEMPEFKEGPYGTFTNLWTYIEGPRGHWFGPLKTAFIEEEVQQAAEMWPTHIYFLHNED